MDIFLTGATGTIGSAVLAQALQAGHSVTALTRSQAAADAVAAFGASAVVGDLAHPETWIAHAARADAFIHLANSFVAQMAETEPRLLQALFAHTAQRETPLRFIYTGGCWLYGETGTLTPATEKWPLNPIRAFDWAAKAITSLDGQPGLKTAILHPGMVYHEAGGVFARMLRALRLGSPAPIWGDPKICWPLVHRDDAAAAYLAMLDHPDATGPFIATAESHVPVGEIADALHAQAGIRSRPAVLPRKYVLMQHGNWAEGPMLDQSLTSVRMTQVDWRPIRTDFRTLTYRF